MSAKAKSAAAGLTVRLPPELRSRVDAIARAEHRSAAAYIEGLVENDLRARDEQSRVIRVYHAADLPDRPAGTVRRGEGETKADYARRTALLDLLTGA